MRNFLVFGDPAPFLPTLQYLNLIFQIIYRNHMAVIYIDVIR